MNGIINFLKTTALFALIAMLIAGAYILGQDRDFNQQALEAANAAKRVAEEAYQRTQEELSNTQDQMQQIADLLKQD